jgi:2-polyprenyl-3-methyl-5-hydroxy-6-metoxy-1,4-benzoquinol methylase
LHHRIDEVAAECIGVDLDAGAVELLNSEYGLKNIQCGDAENLDAAKLGQFDVVIAGEIIEHLNNPGMFLESARACMKSDAKLVLTTVNAYCLRRLIRIPFGVESVHPDHVSYYSHPTLHSLASRYGYELVEAHSYRIKNKKPLLPYLVERVATLISPNLGEGIIRVYTKAQ